MKRFAAIRDGWSAGAGVAIFAVSLLLLYGGIEKRRKIRRAEAEGRRRASALSHNGRRPLSIEGIAEFRAGLQARRDRLCAELEGYGFPLPEVPDAVGFCDRAQRAFEALRRAAKESGAAWPANSEPFARYVDRGHIPPDAEVPRLTRQLRAVRAVAETLIECRVDSVRALDRERFEISRDAPEEGKGGNVGVERVVAEFDAKEAALRETLNRMAEKPSWAPMLLFCTNLNDMTAYDPERALRSRGLATRLDVLHEEGGSLFCGPSAVARRERIVAGDEPLRARVVVEIAFAAPGKRPVEENPASRRETFLPAGGRLFCGPLRVAAIGSGYPIPPGATRCPFSGVPQPPDDRLDRDSDGMADEWERRNGLNPRSAADARVDSDADGFLNAEEARSESDPFDARSHPSYAEKLRFAGCRPHPFPFVFAGCVRLPDGRAVFQINVPGENKSVFSSAGDRLGAMTIVGLSEEGPLPALEVLWSGERRTLPLNAEIVDRESWGEVINMLDCSTQMVTMGSLLSVRNDEFLVLRVGTDGVVVRSAKGGKPERIARFVDGDVVRSRAEGK